MVDATASVRIDIAGRVNLVSDGQACRTNDVKTRLSHLTRRSPTSDEGGWRRRVVAYGKTMWSRHPLLVSNRRWLTLTQPG